MDRSRNAHRYRSPRATRLMALFVWLLPLVGCGPLLLGSPEIHRFHAIDVVAPSTQVQAYRIDIEHGDHVEHWQLTAVPIPEDGRIAGKTFVTWHHREASGNARLHLYRPGFQTIEILPWHKTGRLQWERAADLAAREKAIDDLLGDGSHAVSPDLDGETSELLLSPWEDALSLGLDGGTPRNLPRHERLWPHAFGHLRPGTVSEDHRRALEFAAFEYERLADQAFSEGPQPDKIRSRIRAKSAWLGKLAAGRRPSDP